MSEIYVYIFVFDLYLLQCNSANYSWNELTPLCIEWGLVESSSNSNMSYCA